MGWIAKGQLDDQLDRRIFATAVGGRPTSSAIIVGSRRRRAVPVLDPRRGDAGPTEDQLDDLRGDRLQLLVRRAKKEAADTRDRTTRVRRSATAGPGRCSTRSSPRRATAGARPRGGAADRRRGAPDRDADRGVAAAAHRAARLLRTGRRRAAPRKPGRPARTAAARPARRRGPRPDRRAPAPVSGRRHGRSARLSGRAGAQRATIAHAGRRDLGRPLYVAADRAGAGRGGAVVHALHQRPPAPARRLPVGPRADPRVAAEAPARGDVRGLRRARAGATPALAEELGDLLLQVVLHAQLAAEAGVFDLADVQAAIARKIVRRHPHVFGDAVARTARDVNRQWERIKADEREAAAPRPVPDGRGEGRRRRGARARGRPRRHQPVAAGPGREPGDAGAGRRARLRLAEHRRRPRQGRRGAGGAARGRRHRRRRAPGEEFGDLLFVARERRAASSASRPRRRCAAANDKFRRRFGRVERMARERGVALRDLDFEALDELWDAAKARSGQDGAATADEGAHEHRQPTAVGPRSTAAARATSARSR